MPWQFGIASDIGERDEQQDRVGIIASENSNEYLIVVADGMGGYQGGALAAQAVVDSANQFFDSMTATDPLAALETLCARAHQAITDVDEKNGSPPGSTCVLLYLSSVGAYWAHVGDSRLYHLRLGKIMTRTLDHSMIQLLVSQGRMTEAEMTTSQVNGQLYMRLGGEQQPKPDLGSAEVQEGDIFMLCSDGFWESINTDEVSTVLSKSGLEAGAEMLVRMARERGSNGGDNITLALAQLGRKRKKFRVFSSS